MKNLLLVFITCKLLYGCKTDCFQTIVGVQFHPAPSFENGYEETQFLTKDLIFSAKLELDQDYGGTLVTCRNPKIKKNAVLESSFVLTCDHDLYLPDDTLTKNSNLIDHFRYKSIEEKNWRQYNFINKEPLQNENGYYKFRFSAVLSDSTVLTDSCIAKINFQP